ncbi:hypothetical protein VPH35_025973 [Triticum aestivum]
MFTSTSSARALGKSLVVPADMSSAMVTTAAAAGKAKMTALAITAGESMAEMKKNLAAANIAAADNNNNTCKDIVVAAAPALPPAPTRPNIFAVITRLADRPFLSAGASGKLTTLGKKLAKKLTMEAARTMIKMDVKQLVDDLDAAFQAAELALDDIEHQHLCLQALIMSHQDDKKNLASKLRFGLRRSRMKARIEKRQIEVEAIVNKAYRRVVGSKKKSKSPKY